MIARSKAFNGDKYYFLLEALLEMGLILLLACLYEGQAGLLRGWPGFGICRCYGYHSASQALNMSSISLCIELRFDC